MGRKNHPPKQHNIQGLNKEKPDVGDTTKREKEQNKKGFS